MANSSTKAAADGDFLGNPFRTREEVKRACIALLDPLQSKASHGGAVIKIGSTATHYDDKAVALEAFARPLWGLASLLAGGEQYDGAKLWVEGLASGTDPESEGYWGLSADKDQRMVEMSPLSYAIALCPDKFYHSQTPQVQQNICLFLQSCIGKRMPDTNWLWFRVFANIALRTVQSDFHNGAQMQRDLSRLEEFQLDGHAPSGDDSGSAGWSRDGPEDVKQLDYYSSSFAIQVAQMLYSKLAATEDPVRCDKYKQRAQDFVKDFFYYFADDGSAIPFGRSMVYRFAVIATASVLPMADIEPPAPLSWGHIKGLVLRHLRSWNDAQDIFRSDGTLNIGYRYDCMNMTENYNAPGSPYWCMKAFLCLGASSDHPFWVSEELPWPSDLFPKVKALPDPSHIMCRQGGHTFLLSSGQSPHYAMRAGPAKYCKFGYSSAFGFSCPSGDMDIGQVAPDSMLALRDVSGGVDEGDGETWRVRRKPIEARLERRGTDGVHLRAKWKPWHDVEVETWLFPPTSPSSSWYLRVHRITSGRKLRSVEGGWATYGQGPDGRALVQDFSGVKSEGGDEEEGWARAVTSGGAVGLKDLSFRGSLGKRLGKLVQIDPNTNVIFSRGVLPSLVGEIDQGETWLATAVFGKPTWETSQERENAWEDVPEVSKVTRFVL
ncbi:hypothetical protein I350_00429 [Cryptococcus amylolentus CBS 6273]|uniref:Uncharacterized protein n=1 Tax=Cryptococcus amylolentus CBS 6273 TaxID=1296118 RepID=A0A1E3KF52_9TREE|nr:hypothetical protein I350_00429 [Cryptococcus amylolentus CBS 6273]